MIYQYADALHSIEPLKKGIPIDRWYSIYTRAKVRSTNDGLLGFWSVVEEVVLPRFLFEATRTARAFEKQDEITTQR